MFEIRKITAETTFIVRNPVLRPNQPIENCRFEGDDLHTTTHFGYFNEEKLVGILSVFQKTNDCWQSKNQIQLRGMAVLADFQKKGIGEELIKKVIEFAQNNQVELIWFNAREKAVSFYEKLGFHKKGTAFEITGIGTHYLMYQKL